MTILKQKGITALRIQKRNREIIEYWEANKDTKTDIEIRNELFKKDLGSNMTTFRVIAAYKAEKYQSNRKRYKESDWAKYFFTKMVKESLITADFKAEFAEIEKALDCKKFWKICFSDETGYYVKVHIQIGKHENSAMIDLMQRNVQLMVESQAIIRKLIDSTL